MTQGPAPPAAAEDFSADKQPAAGRSLRAPEQPLDHKQEQTRGRLAMGLLWLLGGSAALAFILIGIALFLDKDGEPTHIDSLLRVVALVFNPLTTLVGSALGFYFAGTVKKGR